MKPEDHNHGSKDLTEPNENMTASDDSGDVGRDPFLYAIAKNPRGSSPLSDAEMHSIKSWIQGVATYDEIKLARASVRKNLAAREFLFSLELEKATESSPPVPSKVTDAIMRHVAPEKTQGSRFFFRLPHLSTVSCFGTAAMVAIAVVAVMSVNHFSLLQRPPFQVATLADRSLLNEDIGVIRGGGDGVEQSAITNVLDFMEFDVPTQILNNLFQPEDGVNNPDVMDALADISERLPIAEQATTHQFIFDQELQAAVERGIETDLIILRVYDLETPSNASLTGLLSASAEDNAFFITLAP